MTDGDGTACEATVVEFDDYGFVITSDDTELGVNEQLHVFSGVKCTPSVLEKWEEIMSEYKSSTSQNILLHKKLRQLIRVGGYNSIRGDIWKMCLGVSETKERENFNYKGNVIDLCTRLERYGLTVACCDGNIRKINMLLDVRSHSGLELTEEECKWLRNSRQIMLDIARTFPTHCLFIGKTKEKQSLFQILMMYSTFNSSIGYCQGMAYVAALLIMHISDEEDVFWSIVTLFDSDKYLAGFYDSNLSRMLTCAEVFSLLLRDRQTQLAQHLGNLSIHPLMYITSWFMCIFTNLPCWHTVLTICDLFLLEGYQCLFRGALSILEVCSAELLAMDQMGNILPFIQKLPSRLASHPVLIPVLWRTTVENSELEQYENIVLNGTVLKHAEQPTAAEFKTPRKRRKISTVASTPGTQSLFRRIVSALTPVSSSHTSSRYTRDTTSSLRQTTTPLKGRVNFNLSAREVPRDVSTRKPAYESAKSSRRKRKRENLENYDPVLDSGAIEMKEILQIPEKRKRYSSSFSSSNQIHSPFLSPSLPFPPTFCFSPSQPESGGDLVCETPSSKLGLSPLAQLEPLCGASPVLRRSQRVVAKRRRKSGGGKFSSPFPLFPLGECLLEDSINTSNDQKPATIAPVT